MNDLNSGTWNTLRKFGYRANAASNVAFGVGAYVATYTMQQRYGKWNKLSSLISSTSILGRCVSVGFICIAVSSWLCSYYCFNNKDNGNMENHHIFVLKSSVLLFSISTYYCIALFANLKIQKIDIPEIDLQIIDIAPHKFVITGSILATFLAIPTSLMFTDWIKDCYRLYKEYKSVFLLVCMASFFFLLILLVIGYCDEKTHSTSDGQEITTTLHTYSPTICDPTVDQHSGYVYAGSKNGSNNSYFYWFFESRHDPQNDPLIMWLQGGPGCSSQIALLAENGPCRIINNGSFVNDTISNPYSWNSNANIIFVDEPAATGFSTGFPASTLVEISADMWAFLQHFMSKFPAYFKNGFFITGESYAGHYIPNIVSYIHRQNKHNHSMIAIPLTGFAIGNGLTDPLLQLPSYAQMAYNSSTAINSKYDGMPIEKQLYVQIEKLIANCSLLIEKCYATRDNKDCFNATHCWNHIVGSVAVTGVNRYNLNIKCEMKHLCYDFVAIDNWLNLKEVQDILGVAENIEWQSCNKYVAHPIHASGQTMTNSRELLSEAVDDGIRGLIFAGDLDYICNWLGNEAWTLQLQWKGQESFKSTKMSDWIVNGNVAGQMRQGRNTNFTFLRVYDAGHMVPMDKPQIALQLINQFLSNTLMSKENVRVRKEYNSNHTIQATISVQPSTLANLWGMLFLEVTVVIWCFWHCQRKSD